MYGSEAMLRARSDQARLAGVGLLAVLVMVLGMPFVINAIATAVPALGVVKGIRMPIALPAIATERGADEAWPYWLIDTVAAFFLLQVFAVWMSRQRPGGRGRTFVNGFRATAMAVILASLVKAVIISFLTADVIVSYGILIGGTLLFSIVIGAAFGVLVGLVVSFFPMPATPTNPGVDRAPDPTPGTAPDGTPPTTPTSPVAESAAPRPVIDTTVD